eukprot:gene6180-7694_t
MQNQTATTTTTLVSLLQSLSVDSLQTPKGHVIVVNSDMNPIDGFKLILDNKIQSAPVFDKSTGKFTGFLDIKDLVSFCVFLHDSNVKVDTLVDIINFGLKMFKNPTEVTVTYLSRRNLLKEVTSGSNICKAIDILSQGYHRVPIKDQDGKITNIISQSSIIQYIQKNVDNKILTELDCKISELPELGVSNVLSVKKTMPAIEVFKIMDQQRRTSIAVTDENDKFLYSIDSKDINVFLNYPSIPTLQLPIQEFLVKTGSNQALIDLHS